MAVLNNHPDVARLLLEYGADVDADDFWGRTPLWAAVETRNMDVDNAEPFENGVDRAPVLELIALLVDKGAKVFLIPGNHDEFVAGYCGHFGAVEILPRDIHTTAAGRRLLNVVDEMALASGQTVPRVYVLHKGVVVEQGLVDQVLDRPEHPYTERLIASIPRSCTRSRGRRASSMPGPKARSARAG